MLDDVEPEFKDSSAKTESRDEKEALVTA